jgi:hypothetical protein
LARILTIIVKLLIGELNARLNIFHIADTITEIINILQQFEYEQNNYFLKELKTSTYPQIFTNAVLSEAEQFISFLFAECN